MKKEEREREREKEREWKRALLCTSGLGIFRKSGCTEFSGSKPNRRTFHDLINAELLSVHKSRESALKAHAPSCLISFHFYTFPAAEFSGRQRSTAQTVRSLVERMTYCNGEVSRNLSASSAADERKVKHFILWQQRRMNQRQHCFILKTFLCSILNRMLYACHNILYQHLLSMTHNILVVGQFREY